MSSSTKQFWINTGIVLALGLIPLSVAFGGWLYVRGGDKAKTEARLEATEKRVDKVEIKTESIESRQRDDSERMIRVETKMDGIKESVDDIKRTLERREN